MRVDTGGVIDVLVVGGGPAGRALAAECGSRGLATTLVDPAPDAPWRATYGAWLDELPAGLPPPAATARGRVIARTAHALDRTYAVLDVPALRAHLDARLAAAGVRVVAGRVTGRAHDGPSARGRACSPTAPAWPPTCSSTRAGTGLPCAQAGSRAGRWPPSRPPTASWWTPPPPRRSSGRARRSSWTGAPTTASPAGPRSSTPSRSAAAPCCWRRPRSPAAPACRCPCCAAVCTPGSLATASPRPRTPRSNASGSPSIGPATRHPACSASVPPRRSCTRPPDSAWPTRCGSPRPSPTRWPAAAWTPPQHRLWPARAVAVHRLRRIGLEALLRMPAEAVPAFFETFFALPERHRRAYLSGRDDLPGHLAAMGALFGRADTRLRGRLVGPAFRRPRRPSRRPGNASCGATTDGLRTGPVGSAGD